MTFEQLGKRALVLCTHPFEVTAKNIARTIGLPVQQAIGLSLATVAIGAAFGAMRRIRRGEVFWWGLALLGAGNLLRKLGGHHQAVLTELMTRSLGDYLDMWFEGEALKGAVHLAET